jgi:hypothetical protein
LAWFDDVSFDVEQAMRSAILEQLKKVRDELQRQAAKIVTEPEQEYAE